MSYPWYKEIHSSNDITQGDILLQCWIPLPNKSLYETILSDKIVCEQSLDIKEANVIVLSQACDIRHDKVESLVVCPIWSLKKWFERNSYFKSSTAKENLRQGKEPAYHLLNEYNSTDIKFKYSVVDFHRIYSLPKDYIKSLAENIDIRLRLLPPYREHLSQAFARYFMRVGLPMGIDRDWVKKINS